MPGRTELRADWNNAGKDVVVLHMMERGRTRPNLSPFALKFETFLKVRTLRELVVKSLLEAEMSVSIKTTDTVLYLGTQYPLVLW